MTNTPATRPSARRGLCLSVLGVLIAAGAVVAPANATAPVRAAPAERAELPSVDEILKRYVEATGGEERIKAHEHRTMKGKFEIPMAGLAGTATLHSSAPNLMLMVIDMEGVGEMKSGFDGEHGWSSDPMQGDMLMEGGQLAQTRRQADFFAALNFDKNYETIEVAQKTTFEGQDVYELHMTDAEGVKTQTFFSTDSGLMVGMRAEMDSPMGKIPATTVIGGYKEFDGLKMPMEMTIRVMNMEQRLEFEEVNHDRIDKDLYTPPQAIRTMIERQQGDG